MQFIANSEHEYISTVNSIIGSNIYDKNSMIYALDITDNVVAKMPDSYPCIVSLEFEEFETDNRRYAFQACKFVYLDELLSGFSYQDKLSELDSLDTELKKLEVERDTSGEGFPLLEIAKLENSIYTIEKQIF